MNDWTTPINIPTAAKPLGGWRVLVPRGGPWGDSVAGTVRGKGGSPVVAPMINFANTDDPESLTAALTALEAGEFDWLTVTSATTVDVLSSQRIRIPENTKVAAVGETTAAALIAVGYQVDLVPAKDNSAKGMVQELTALEPEPRRFLTLRSAIAKPLLTQGLITAGHDVQSVVAYRTVGVAVTDKIVADVASGKVRAILVTSGSVAEQVRTQFPEIPDDTVIAAIGPRTARDARGYGLRVDVVAEQQTVDSLIDAIVRVAQERA
ncbi:MULTISPECIES: uroporphyrinogen-III synthase [unclassified Plantibacter]|uniref:uroporphyrinogen-III synthase n=1 Tax=unclassified Plantibacter TaxID=2624265 RepID=UPI003D33A692